MPSLMRLENVVKCYAAGTSHEIFPLRGVNLDVGWGERVILLGKSGSGKTTFLNMAGGVDLPTSGRIIFRDQDISLFSPSTLARYRRKEVGFIFQSFNLFPTLTVGENVTLPLDLLGVRDEARARQMLADVGLETAWKKFPEQLSGGEQQRVAVARALVKDPALILADEPTGNLDFETGNRILEIIDEVSRRRNAALMMATHSADALWLADRVLRLRGGRLIQEPGQTEEESPPVRGARKAR